MVEDRMETGVREYDHDIIVRYNDALSLLGGKTACV